MTEVRRRRPLAVLCAAVLAVLMAASVADAAAAATRSPGDVVREPAGRPSSEHPEAPRTHGAEDAEPTRDGDGELDPVEAAAAAYLRVHPAMSREQALQAAKGQDRRKALYDELLAERQRELGGAWFDAPAGVLHVSTTTPELAEATQEVARELGLTVELHRAEFAFVELDAVAERLRGSDSAVATAAQGNVGVDVRRNRVLAAVPEEQIRELQQTLRDKRVVLVPAREVDVEADACTARDDCNDSVRAGSILWRGSLGNDWCSAGITGRSSATNWRYVITAGHCSNGNGVTWGTGSGTIGTMAFSADAGSLDAGAIRATWWPYTWQPGGDIYMHLAANRRVDMDWVAPTQGYIWVGDTVCLAANYTNPTAIGNRCGVVSANSDVFVRGMTRVDGLDACGGDSGGGWYWLTGSGYRVGFGVHSRSSTGCNGSQGGSQSWFTTVPRVASWFPALQFETQ